MTDRSDHLIERAAALLRSANAGQVFDPPPSADPVPDLPPPRNPQAPRAPATPPRFVPPPRPTPPIQLSADPAGARRSQSVLARGGSVADIRALSTHAPIELAMLERAGLMVARSSRTRTTEEYRIVIGRVLRALHEEPDDEPMPAGHGAANVVMITSARPGEGKSFTALNLSGSIAQNAGESVLLVDVDAKHTSMTEQLGLRQLPGFLDLVAKPDLSPDEFIIPTDLPNLSVLPLGQRAADRPDDSDDYGAPEARRLTPPILRLAQRFPKSLIVLDAPPCLSTSDPHTLSPAVGQIVMVVEAERTQRSEVEGAIELVRVCPNITMLLNKVRMNTNHTFGSYDYFGSYT
jgi:receptor protein-tyrosine kinase